MWMWGLLLSLSARLRQPDKSFVKIRTTVSLGVPARLAYRQTAWPNSSPPRGEVASAKAKTRPRARAPKLFSLFPLTPPI